MVGDLYSALPVVLISFLAISSIVLDAFIKKSQEITFRYACLGLIVVGAAAALVFNDQGIAFSGMLRTGGFASFFDILFVLGGILTLLSARPYLLRNEYELDEFYSLVLFAIGGMMLMAHANHLLTVFIGVEIMSISFYVLSGYIRTSILSVEAALKYFLLGAFATGFLVYGMALIYGATGAMEYGLITTAITAGTQMPVLLLVGVGLVIVGLSFKVAAFPFHLWVPDVYQGAPTVVTGFMSTAGKAAAFAAFIPVMQALLTGMEPVQAEKIQILIAVVAAASMLYGNISALAQNNIKRMLAYSSIAHAGYILMGIVAYDSPKGESGAMFYLAAYLFMQLGAFVILSLLETRSGENLEFKDYAGLGKRHPVLAALMALFMFSLTGIPPLAGFFGKYYLFVAAIESGFTWLTIIAVVSSVISVYFYLGLVVTMYFREPAEGDDAEISLETGLAGLTLLATSVGVLLFGLFPDLILSLTN